MSFRYSPLVAVLALALGHRAAVGQASSPVAAAAAVRAAAPSLFAGSGRPEPTPPQAGAALKRSYRLRLTSVWPQESAGGCRNGGEETIEGDLARRPDGTYAGMLARHTTLLFCGAHGAAGAACSLTLTGAGPVAMTGMVLGDQHAPSGRALRVTWLPAPGQDAWVIGACAEGFKRAMREMYLTTAHAAEFPATTVGAGPVRAALDSYAWKVELN